MTCQKLFFKKNVNNTKVKNVEDKIPDIINLATNTAFSTKMNEVKNKMPSIKNLAATSALNANIPNITNLATTTVIIVENKILNVSNLVKKIYRNTKN